MGRPTRPSQKRGAEDALEEQTTRFLQLLASNIQKDGVPVSKLDLAKARGAIKDSISALPNAVSFKAALVNDIDRHVDSVISTIKGETDATQGLGRYPFNLMLENGLADALAKAKSLPSADRRQRYRLLLASAPNSDIAATVADDFYAFENEDRSLSKSAETIMRSLELACAGEWTPAAVCTLISIFFNHYGLLADTAIQAPNKKQLGGIVAVHQAFLARLSLYLGLMGQPLKEWPVKWRQRYYSLMAATLAQYADILLVIGDGHAGAEHAASQLAAIAIHFLALSFEHLLDMLLSLSPVQRRASGACNDSILHLYTCVLSRGRHLEQQLSGDANLYGKYLLSARRAQIFVGTLLQDSPAMDDILRDCVLIPMPASFSHLVPDIAKHVMGKRGTADFNGQLVRYILYKSSLDEVNAAIEQLTAGASEPGDMEPDEATTFFIDATGAGEVSGAGREATQSTITAVADADVEAELQAEIDAMLGNIGNREDKSDDEDASSDDGEQDVLRYVPRADGHSGGDILHMLDAPGTGDLEEVSDGEQGAQAPATRTRIVVSKRQPDDVPESQRKRTRAAKA